MELNAHHVALARNAKTVVAVFVINARNLENIVVAEPAISLDPASSAVVATVVQPPVTAAVINAPVTPNREKNVAGLHLVKPSATILPRKSVVQVYLKSRFAKLIAKYAARVQIIHK